MLRAADFRARARMALQNNWLWAVLTGFVAGLLGAAVTALSGDVSSIVIRLIPEDVITALFERLGNNVFFSSTEWYIFLQGVVVFYVFLVYFLLVFSIVMFIIGGTVSLGYAQYNLNLVDGKEAGIANLFGKFDCFGQGFCVQFLRHLFTVLWTFVFIIPGIVKIYSYSMAIYIAAENPDMDASNAIAASQELMNGNKWRLFCLDLSFIGWSILCTFTLGIGHLFLAPYRDAAFAAFYREIVSERTPVKPEQVIVEENPYFAEV